MPSCVDSEVQKHFRYIGLSLPEQRIHDCPFEHLWVTCERAGAGVFLAGNGASVEENLGLHGGSSVAEEGLCLAELMLFLPKRECREGTSS